MRQIELRPGEAITIGDTVIHSPISNRGISAQPDSDGQEGAFSKSTSQAGLLEYLNSLTPDAQTAFATRCEKSIGYLRQVAYGKRTCREKLAINIDRESGGVVGLQTLRPDVDWDHVRQQGRTEGGEHA